MSNPNIAVVESYIHAIRDKDLSRLPLADEVSFEDPLTPKLSDKAAVVAFISNFLPAINGVTIHRHIAEGEYVATFWEADTTFGVLSIFECFRVIDGQIKEVRAFLDPRPITNAQS
jgi:hypothetical protein